MSVYPSIGKSSVIAMSYDAGPYGGSWGKVYVGHNFFVLMHIKGEFSAIEITGSLSLMIIQFIPRSLACCQSVRDGNEYQTSRY